MTTAGELQARVDVIEESYEFFLAYAAQGVPGEQGSGSAGQVGEFLKKLDEALVVLADLFSAALAERDEAELVACQPFIEVLRRDAASSLAAVRLVRRQPVVSSQMIDNLNAMIHLRALLTDVFLIDEILNPRVPDAPHPENPTA
ncbi:MAG: hypothetical protein J4F30_05500 [Acidobacteria bacterium]|nr:hypothetical protein [Acidobacteriota bacterium]